MQGWCSYSFTFSGRLVIDSCNSGPFHSSFAYSFFTFSILFFFQSVKVRAFGILSISTQLQRRRARGFQTLEFPPLRNHLPMMMIVLSNGWEKETLHHSIISSHFYSWVSQPSAPPIAPYYIRYILYTLALSLYVWTNQKCKWAEKERESTF